MKSSLVRQIHDDIAVVGWACRLPGANSVDELWSLLIEGRCAISQVPGDRFPLDRFYHPRRQERGKSYTWAAGVLDDVWGFDPSVFGISPREAVQMDPQQRILLELTWEALEDAGIPPSSIANSEVGVFVGASQADYGHAFVYDPSIGDAHFGPGTALAVLANRISYIYGLTGPSITVDTACSSSLVALHHAIQAIRSGRIETAIVGGSNLMVSPAAFIAFSQANMLSPTGRCQAFSAGADGFVRGEGAVVMVLRKAALAESEQNPLHGLVVATDVNSDGRTNGISLPSLDGQEALLSRVYHRGGIDVDRLAFVEAHGTGTPVGDPVEAAAIGRAIGQRRSTPLPIGSIKTNIGHLEPGAGLAGVLKALLALNHGLLPPSLHFEKPNPHIQFEKLNLSVCTQPLLLPQSADQLAGVNSFGFGGTNAHVVVRAGRKASPLASEYSNGCDVFTFSANSGGALQALAREYRNRVGQQSDRDTEEMASAIAHRRERLPHRLVVSSTRTPDVTDALDAFLVGREDPRLTVGTAVGRAMPVAFVYSGAGGKGVGMGHAAYRNNAAFRDRFDEVDGCFKQIGGWSVKDLLFSDDVDERLLLASFAQPLIFAVQSASTAALSDAGLKPAVILGHSVGEVAAAEASGALDLRTALKVIHARSFHQENKRGTGRMAAVLASADSIGHLLEEVGGIEIAAINSPRTVAIAGATDALSAFKKLAKKQGIAVLDLGLAYPFHSAMMDSVKEPLEAELREIRARDGDVPFISTVTGTCVPGSRLNSAYWWRNVRETVHFTTAMRAAAELGARYFMEVGPRATLVQHITDTLKGEVTGFATYTLNSRLKEGEDPFAAALAHAVVSGAQIDTAAVFGPDPGPGTPLPRYPWQRSAFRFESKVETVDSELPGGVHPFAGARSSEDALDWHAHVDVVLYPELADHKLGDRTIFPGTGFLEIALVVARRWMETENVTLAGFEILNPLDLTNDETREILTRVSPASRTLEILSRPRRSELHWSLHCRCKMQVANAASARCSLVPAEGGTVIQRSSLYALAHASGLHYGPAFRLVQQVVVHEGGLISVELMPPQRETSFTLDPMRLDSVAHGFFPLFPELRAVERGVTYIPVRMEEVSLIRPHVPPQRALIQVKSQSDRSITGDCYVFDKDDQVVAVLRGVRCQSIPMRRTGEVDTVAFVELPCFVDGTILGETGVGVDVDQIVAHARSLTLLAESPRSVSESEMLIDGWAFAAAYEIASSLTSDGSIDVEALIEGDRLPEVLRPWLLNILASLGAANLAARGSQSWTLLHDPSLPNAASVVGALAHEQPHRAGEVLMAAAVGKVAQQLAGDATHAAREVSIPKAVLDFYHTTSVSLREASEVLHKLLTEDSRLWPDNRTLRVLQIGFAPLAKRLLASERDIRLTVFEPDRRRFTGAELALGKNRAVTLVDAGRAHELGEYDLILGVGGLHRLPGEAGIAEVRRMLSPGGLLVAVEPRASLFKDLVFGLDSAWFAEGLSDRPVSPLRAPGAWVARLEEAGFGGPRALTVGCGSELACLIVASAQDPEEPGSEPETDVAAPAPDHETMALIVGAADSCELRDRLAASLSAVDWRASSIHGAGEWPAFQPDVVIHVPAFDHHSADPVGALTQRCLEIRACAERLSDERTQLWLVFSGALAAGASQVRPVETGAWGFARTLANEFPHLDVRKVDLAPALPKHVAADLLRRIVTSGTRETELHVDDRSVRAVRVTGLKQALQGSPSARRTAVQLERRPESGQRLSWRPTERKRPGTGEVEVEVEATGLNFRDVMWSMSLLPEDMLEDGFSGPSLGLECTGTISRVGAEVGNLQVGDRVMAFAASSFASHVTIGGDQAIKLPENLTCEAAATIPVAFFTAYYGLITQAKLKRREWVLVHGGAGAVGLAAIQIARARGAKVIATAGSPAKRHLLRALGVPHVFDSRSTDFVDHVREVTGDGVDVVLNSLAGEAMERSLSCLRPFGRFVELGKRDYVADTHIGLRPFRRNLTYFGVDVDQVIGSRKVLGDRVFAKIIAQFEKGTYVPLPYSVFDDGDVSAAFHLMQQSSHIGKILVRPPSFAVHTHAGKPFKVNTEGTHVITGAFGGFGMETAKWLVEKGARHLVMIGRRGAATEDERAVVSDFAARGVKVLADPCDVTDGHALERLFETMHATMPRVVGVIHAAMVLDDGILANLDAERFHRVLAPKVAGAENLDRLVRGERLDYFVLFSSVTTLIGNPGQANYVAANAYMEGLARRRRQAGLPALAIGWGPITDVGVVAQDERLQAGLQRLTGVTGMTAREALALMEQALAQSPDAPHAAVMTISPTESSFTADRLAVLRSPTYEGYVNNRGPEGGDADTIDLRAIAAREGVDAARRKAADVIAVQVAHVLQLREEEVSQVRPLSEIGLDSLMALELVMNLEERFGIRMPLTGASGGVTIAAIADQIVAHVGLERDRRDAVVATMAEQHHGEVEQEQIVALKEIMTEDARTSKRLLN